MSITHRTKEFGIYHWDTFDNETLLVAERNTLLDAEAFVMEHYKGRISQQGGADRVDIVDSRGNVRRAYYVT